MKDDVVELESCPFCGVRLNIRAGVNSYGRCDTEGCWFHERRVTVPLYDPVQVAAYNARPHNPAATEIEALRDRVRELEGRDLPDIGPRPNNGDDGADERLKRAYQVQQQGVPDQTALVWRPDLLDLFHRYWRLEGLVSLAARQSLNGGS